MREGVRPEAALTPQRLMALDYLPVPPALAGYVTTFYHFRCDELVIRDVHPAGVGHLMVMLRGTGRVKFDDGHADPTHRVQLLAASSSAALIEVEGTFHCIGAALAPAGWAALTGLHAGEFRDRMIAASSVFGDAIDTLGDALVEAYEAGTSGADLCARLAEFLSPRLRKLNPRHAALIRDVAAWLGGSLDASPDQLYDLVCYSPRQCQRLTERYFGLPPRELKRKYRAVRAATLLNMPDLPEARLAETIGLFADQSHLIREVRHYVGRTPGRLVDEENTILTTLLDIRNFREISPQVAAMPPGISENDSQ